LVARNITQLRETEDLIHKINPNVQVLSVQADITDEASVGGAFEIIKRAFGTADILVNNAGSFRAKGQVAAVSPND
jgi:NAD(P)-dependent dehydrogenase (short-subunit alcohol dehydrogenase family)